MRHPLSGATAAVLLVVASAGVALWFHGFGATFAFADFIQPILGAKTVTYKATAEMKGPPAMTITSVEMVLDTTRSRQETEMPNKSKTVRITDWSQGKSLGLDPAAKQATVLEFTNAPKRGQRPLFLVSPAANCSG